MAKYNEILSGRFNRALQKMLSMKGQVPAPQLTSEITPGFTFPLGAEFSYLESWQRFGLFTRVAAVAAQQAALRMRNPAGSNIVMVVEKILWAMEGAATDELLVSQAAIATDLTAVLSLTATRVDSRGQQNPTAVISTGNGAAFPALASTRMLTIALPNTPQDLILDKVQELPLLPGDAYQFQTSTLNQTLPLSLLWRERFLEDSERT